MIGEGLLLAVAMGAGLEAPAIQIPAAYVRVGSQYGVPPAVFFSVALQESGHSRSRRFLPWPWTLNVNGQGYYFDDRVSAEAALAAAVTEAEREGRIAKVAIGLGQIYWPSHHRSFPRATLALDPGVNLHYAARLLAAEYSWTVKQGRGDWWEAVGRYHTPSRPDLAAPYRLRVYQRCTTISPDCARFGRAPMEVAAI